MEWTSVLGSAIGSSPAAALSFYWAKAAWKARENREAQHQKDMAAKDAIIAQKDAQIATLQQSRVDDLRAIMVPTSAPLKPKQNGSETPL